MSTCTIQHKRSSIQMTLIGSAMKQTRRRKNVFIDQQRIDRVKVLLCTDTETETIDRALALAEDFARFDAEVTRGLAGLIGRGGFVDHFSAKRRSE